LYRDIQSETNENKKKESMLPSDGKQIKKREVQEVEAETMDSDDDKLVVRKASGGAIALHMPNSSSTGKPENTKSDKSEASAIPSKDVIYRDYAAVPPPMVPSRASVIHAEVPLRYRKLPAKLYEMLSTPEYEPVISWMHHGRSWKINDTVRFIDIIIPM
jgi:hypothetical protein